MLRYAVVEIAGKQYKAEPEKIINVEINWIEKLLEVDKVLALANDDKLTLGNPYILNKKIVFDVVGQERTAKIRVATYKAKANTRKVRGSRRKITKIKMQAKNREKA